MNHLTVDLAKSNTIFAGTGLGAYTIPHIWTGTVYANTTWETDQTYLVEGTLTVPTGKTLTIEPGVRVELSPAAQIVISSGGTLVWNANIELVFGENAMIEILGTVKVANGVTLNLPHDSQVYVGGGARFEMGAGSSISTQGIFRAVGTEALPIEFVNRPVGVDGRWEGISVKSHQLINTGELELEHVTLSDGTKPIHIEPPGKATLNFVTISNPTIGIEVIWNPWGPPPSEHTSITNTTIENAQTGIIVDGYSDLLIQECTIVGNEGGGGEAISAGILLTNSSPIILSSHISGFEWGIRGLAASSPILQRDDMTGGFNVITGNGVGAYFEEYSHAILGLYEGDGGQNSISENSANAVVLELGSVVDAYLNWWGSAPPEPELFYIGQECELFYDPYLEEPPGGFAPVLDGGKKGNEPMGSNLRAHLVLKKRVAGDHAAALLLLREIIGDPDEPLKNKTWAIDQITSLGQVTYGTGISTYLKSIAAGSPQLRRQIAAVMPRAHLHERSPQDALAAYSANISSYPNSSIERQALYGQFVHALYGMKDRRAARNLYNDLDIRYASSGQTELAELQLAATAFVPAGNAQPKSTPAVSVTQERPTQFSLRQNYPNPFNPTTTIEYDLPVDTRVSLKLYDVLGREVMSLVDGFVSAGYHEVTLDGSALSSGVYLYRLDAGSFTQVRKLLMLK